MIKVYSIPQCHYCNDLKALLTNEKIEFIDINVNLPENEKEYNELSKVSNSNDVPIIRVLNKLLVPNVSFKSIPEAVELTKKFLNNK